MKMFTLHPRARRTVFWTMLFLAVNLLLAFAGCGPKDVEVKGSSGQSVENNADYQKTIRENNQKKMMPGARASGVPSSQPSGAPSGQPSGAPQ